LSTGRWRLRLAPPVTVEAPTADPATAEATPDQRADAVEAICRQATARGVDAFGAYSTGVTTYAIANSNGLFLSAPRTIASLQVATIAGEGHGFAARAASRIADIDGAAAGEEAIDKAVRTRHAEAIEPGDYPVVLEPYAVAELVEYLSYIGFSGLSVEEGRTFMRLGEPVTGPAVDIWDDGNDPAGLPMPFDFEGVAKRRVDLVEGGVATGVVHDVASAARAGTESTGHGLPAPNPSGAWATNLFMGAGVAASATELARGIERGVWVTRFWYVNILHPRKSLLTGMTRDGTFLIEDGEVTRPIKNMRFTQSVMDAFATTRGLTATRQVVVGSDYDYTVGLTVPAMQLERFNFTSVTR
jgi:predicted Zn-dependent protease